MYHCEQIRQVLEILEANAKENVRPSLMPSCSIAEKLQLSITETKQLLASMNEMGVIECNMEAEYSLITAQGLRKLN